jgi:hypothetical protein
VPPNFGCKTSLESARVPIALRKLALNKNTCTLFSTLALKFKNLHITN